MVVLPFELINNIFQYNDREIYYNKGSLSIRFTKSYLENHPLNFKQSEIIDEMASDLIVIKLNTNIYRRSIRHIPLSTEKVICIEINLKTFEIYVISCWLYHDYVTTYALCNIDNIDYSEKIIMRERV